MDGDTCARCVLGRDAVCRAQHLNVGWHVSTRLAEPFPGEALGGQLRAPVSHVHGLEWS